MRPQQPRKFPVGKELSGILILAFKDALFYNIYTDTQNPNIKARKDSMNTLTNNYTATPPPSPSAHQTKTNSNGPHSHNIHFHSQGR